MPNWCYNYVTISGSNDGVRKIYSRLKEDKDSSGRLFIETIGKFRYKRV